MKTIYVNYVTINNIEQRLKQIKTERKNTNKQILNEDIRF